MRMDSVTTALHVVAVAVWVGSLLSAYVAARVTSGDDTTRHVIAYNLYKWLARPAFLVAFVLGVFRLGMDWRYYFVTTHFMHAKLSLALVAIVAHHFLGARLRSAKTAEAFRTPATTVALAVFALTCFAAVFVVVVRPM